MVFPSSAEPLASDDASNFLTTLEDLARMYLRMPRTEKLSLSTVAALRTLERQGPMRLSDLTASERVTQPAMTQIVSRLERDGLVERRPDPDDGRAVLVRITPPGRRVIEDRHADRVAQLTQIFGRLDAAEQASVVSALPALRRVVELRESPPAATGATTRGIGRTRSARDA